MEDRAAKGARWRWCCCAHTSQKMLPKSNTTNTTDSQGKKAQHLQQLSPWKRFVRNFRRKVGNAQAPRLKKAKSTTVVFLTRRQKGTIDVVVSDGLEKHMPSPARATLIRSLLQTDQVCLRFSMSELKRLCALFREQADLQDIQCMTVVRFCEIVSFDLFDVEGHKQKSRMLEVMNQFFKQIDSNHDGVIDLKEFLVGFSYWRDKVGKSKDKFLFFFTLFDEDRTNTLDLDEFANVVTHVMVSYPDLLQEQMHNHQSSVAEVQGGASAAANQNSRQARLIQQCFDDADNDQDNFVTRQEFLAWALANAVALTEVGTTPEALLLAFDLHDRNRDDKLNQEEFQELLANVHDLELRMPTTMHKRAFKYARMVFGSVDRNGDGVISFDEFKRWLEHNNVPVLQPLNSDEEPDVAEVGIKGVGNKTVKAFQVWD